MKILLLTLLLAPATVLPAQNVSVDGKWKVHTDIAGNESDMVCTFTQKDDALTGSCTSDAGDKPLSGKVDGKTITWQYEPEYEGSPLTVKYKGTLDAAAAKLSGTVNVEQFNADGDFTGVPAPAK
jgi:hypothetical protein